MHGRGDMTFPDKRRYTGDWLNGEMHGHGEMRYPNGKVERGTWENGEFKEGK